MYSEHDRPNITKIAITVGVAVASIAFVIGIVAVVFGLSMSHVRSTEDSASTEIAAQDTATSTATTTSQPPPASASAATAQVAATSPAAVAPAPAAVPAAPAGSVGVVVIDPGHQGKGNSALEPNGPGSSRKKAKVSSGATGVATHVDESERNLQIALVLQKVLESRGVKVVMVRTSQKVNISNAQRAQVANNAHADLFIRLHCDSVDNSSIHGLLTLRPTKNWYAGIDMVGPSKIAASDIHKATLAATGAHDRGITPRGDETGFNWSKVPSVLVEMGVMSNAAEDRKLGTTAYQNELADGMANGIVKFLQSK